MDLFNFFLLIVAVFAGGIASVSGFGIGSLLTPLLAVKTGTSIAVAGVSIAHFLGTALRFWMWRQYINKRVLLSFGVTSAIAGLIGACFHNVFENVVLTIVFGCLLIFAGITGISGLSEKVRLRGPAAWVAGALSGIFGGLVGNQGGIRSAAMLGFELKQMEYVATATGIALAVDIARMPVYFLIQRDEIFAIAPWIAIAAAGVMAGTFAGGMVLRRIPQNIFKKVVSGIILLIGIFVLVHR